MRRWWQIILCLVVLMGISHIKSVTIADGANTDIVRPSDWNSVHAYTLQDAVSLSGNTSGALANISSGTLYLAGGNNITLSQNANSVTISGGNTSQFLTTAMASNRGSDFVQATAAFAGTSASGTIVSNGISVSIGPYLTTAMASNRGSDFVQATAGFNGTNCSGTIASNSISVSVGNYLTTAMASNRGSDFVAATAAFNGTNASGTIASNGISVSVGAPGGAVTLTNCYEPFDLQDGTATMTGSLSQLNVQPFVLPNNLSFGQINFLGIATMPAKSASNSYSARLTNSTQRHTFGSSYSIGNTNFVDWFLFSRGAGVSTSELQTFASTRNSFITNYQMTHNGGATLTNTAGGSLSGSYSISLTISYPFLTSYTSTSVNPASSYTGFSSGYTTWTSAVTTQSTFTFSTSAARTLSIGSTFPATAGWSGAKRINMNFATSLSAGEYWLGYLRHSSSSSASSSANAFTGAAGTGNSYSNTYNHTAFAVTQQLTFAGKTATVVNSLGSLGFVTTANMAMEPGLGSFSGTWASNTTYLNNMANPAGAIALTQVLSNVSMFRSWFQLASNMPV